MRFVFELVLLSLVCGSLAFADDEPIVKDPYGRTFEALTSKLAEYQFTAEEPKFDVKLRPKPVLRWTNPIRKTIDSGVFLWTSCGRPVAVMSAYWSGASSYEHEFQSLADHSFSMRLGDKRWTPDVATKYEVVDDDAQVSKNRSLRRIQMRRMAKSFDAYLVKPDSEEKLRLLPEPLYRYPENVTAERVIDGGLFAFVQATDPEIILVLEAREVRQGQQMWYAGYGRMSAYSLAIKRNDKTVREWGYDKGDRRKGYNVLYHAFVNP